MIWNLYKSTVQDETKIKKSACPLGKLFFHCTSRSSEVVAQGSKLTFLLRSQLATKRKNLVARSKSLVAKLFNIQLSRKHDFKCYFTYKESHNKTT